MNPLEVQLRSSSPHRHGTFRLWWSSAPRWTSRGNVNIQHSYRTAQRIPVYAEFLGSSALVTSLILEHGEDESLLKLPHRFRASQTGSVHLQDDTL